MSIQLTRRGMLCRSVSWLGATVAAGSDAVRSGLAATRKAAASAPSLPVAIQRAISYKPQPLAQRLNTALDFIGGIEHFVRGRTVSIKLNLTGGPRWKLGGLPAHRTYHVHPNFVATTCAALHRAGAKRIVLVESGYDQRELPDTMAAAGWDIDAINAAGDHKVTWEDTRHKGKWRGYSRLAVPWGGYVYPAFDLNSRYEKTDVLVSLAKLKDHANAGVTLSIKNLFGIAPTSIYGDSYDGAGNPTVNEQSLKARGDTFHKGIRRPPDGVPQEIDPKSSRDWSYRVPRVTADLFGARPADLCLIDGIETNRGGEGPWIKGVEPIEPHLLLAGRNGVCTDAIGAAVMGYDPAADHKQFPFMGDNHLTLLADQGVGTNIVEDIEVLGLQLDRAIYPFNPEHRPIGVPIFH